MARQRVLFLCTHNSARSQMAEGLLRARGGEAFEVHSAGTLATTVRPEAIEVMRAIGIDISDHTSKTLEAYINRHFDYVITVCDSANEQCPIFPNADHRLHWSIEDPSDVEGDRPTRRDAFITARDELAARIEMLFDLDRTSSD